MRRIGCIVALLIGVFLIGVVVFFASGLIGDPEPISSRDPAFARLIAAAPDESSVLVVGEAGPFWASFRGNELLGSVVESQNTADLDLAALILGSSSLAVWETPEGTGFASDVSGVRRQILLLAARFSTAVPPLEMRDGLLVSRGGAGSSRDTLSLPEVAGEALIRHGSERETWPPLDPPSVTALRSRDDGGLVLRSVAHAAGPAPLAPGGRFPFEIPVEAAATVTFWEQHDALGAIGKILPIDLEELGRNGVAIAVWDVVTEGLLPQVRAVVMVPRTEESEQAVGRLFSTAVFPDELGILNSRVTSRSVGPVQIESIERLGMTVEAASIGAVFVIAFDDRTMDLFLKSPRRPQPPQEGQRWRVVTEVDRLAPILSKLADDRALRLIAGDLQRSIRDFESILRRFHDASVLEADRFSDGRTEVFEITLSAPVAK